MDKKDTISVIVPIYKVEPYLRQCLDSVVNQTYRNLEIILVDDGSPDNCGSICDEYARKDHRIAVIHKANAGLSAAWNDGIRAATGEWISFVDSDDWIEPDYFEMLVNDSKTKKAEIVHTSGFYREEEKQKYVHRMFLSPFFFENGEGREYLITHTLVRPGDKRTKAKLTGVWGKLYRTSFIKNGGFLFDEKIRAGMPNDALFNVAVYMHVMTASGILYYGYHYRVTDNSGTFRYDPNRPQSGDYVTRQVEHLICRPGTSESLIKVFESFCLRDIVQNLERTFFHPQNKSSNREIAAGIKRMKQMPCYQRAIRSKKNPYNGFALTVFQYALCLPWIWPLRVMVSLWNVLDRREKKTA